MTVLVVPVVEEQEQPYHQCADKYYHAFNADTSFELLCDWFNANKLTSSLSKPL